MLSKGERTFIRKTKTELEEKGKINISYVELYDEFKDNDLAKVLSSYHYQIINMFKDINKRLEYRYIHADVSREMIDFLREVKDFMGNISGNKIKLIENYDNLTNQIYSFLKYSGGSIIPDEFLEILIIESSPIFISKKSLTKEITKKTLNLFPIGKGSYARVYSFYDEYYDEKFVLKCLKAEADEKDCERFNREFDIMKKLNSLFIAKVYKIDREKREYIMEYIDMTLYEYIQMNNSKMSFEDREYIIKQIIIAFEYLAKKNILHRDISPKNVLLKIYEDSLCIKLSDFGLVKIEKSTLTSPNSEARGSLNDPRLADIGFNNYDSSYEMYALTRLIAYILTGKSNFSNIKDTNILEFLNKGTSNKIEERYKDIFELKNNFKILKRKIKN